MNNKKKIYYFGFYSGLGNPNYFLEFPSSNSKMEYIISTLEKLDYILTIYCLGITNINKFRLFSTKHLKSDIKTEYIFSSTIGNKNRITKAFSNIWLYSTLILFIFSKVKRNDIVIVYHSFYLSKIVKICKFILKFKLVYEIEEIYQAAWQKDQSKIDKEISSIKGADGYILVNNLMSTKLALFSKPFVVCYGNYDIKSSIFIDLDKPKKSIVYAGFIGNIESDVWLALKTIEILPDNYVLKILGYGEVKDLDELKMKINSINKKCNFEKVEYCGCLTGVVYSDFLAKCDIGLSTRVLLDEYSDYTFPSKILVYLSHNLIPVSSKINCVFQSSISNAIVFYDDNEPNSVADAILSINNSYNYREFNNLLKDLNNEFSIQLNALLNQLN